MVEALKKSIKLPIAQAVLMLLFPIAASSVHAEQLRDPTRPADMLGRGQSEVAASGPVLQSVLISPQRRIAIISGKTFRVGDKFGDSHVVSISETEVVLQNGKAQQTLKLFPDVHKRLTSSNSAKSDH
ncbi:MAG: MSHA biogenesis protein MshK [Burkholderiaceae bacterium]